MDALTKGIGAIVLVVLVLIASALAFAYPVKWLWNDTMPMMFGLPLLSIFKAWEVLMLTGLLFRNSSTSK